jgi:hypothetical protein
MFAISHSCNVVSGVFRNFGVLHRLSAGRAEMMNGYHTSIGKSEGKRLLAKPRRRWEDNTKVNSRETLWICLAQDKSPGLDFCGTHNEHFGSWYAGSFLASWLTISCSRRMLRHGVTVVVSSFHRYALPYRTCANLEPPSCSFYFAPRKLPL